LELSELKLISASNIIKLRTQKNMTQAELGAMLNYSDKKYNWTRGNSSNKLFEYLASGKPVVMHKLAGIPSSYDPYLFYPEDNSPEALCHTLQYVLDHPAEAAEKGRRAQAFVLENKSSTVQGRRVVEFLSK